MAYLSSKQYNSDQSTDQHVGTFRSENFCDKQKRIRITIASHYIITSSYYYNCYRDDRQSILVELCS